ncbi:MAG: AAA family ATPase [Spirochaeta sp.]|nr:AAA family ATPase [Spirochaeta sp.]
MSDGSEAPGDSVLVLGICGESGAGKSTSTEILQTHGFTAFSVSALVREEAESVRGAGQPREEIQRYARDRQAVAGADYFARRFLRENDLFEYSRVVLDGIRNRHEVAAIRLAVAERNGIFAMLGLQTEARTRFDRVRGRGRGGDPASIEAFAAADARAADEDGFQENLLLVEQADFRVVNEGSVADLEHAITAIIGRLGG